MSSKNRPPWRAPLVDTSGRKHLDIKPPNPRGDWTLAPRCKAKTRAGNPCRNAAMQGAPTCHMHGGHVHAMRTEIARLGVDRVVSLRGGISKPRKALAKLSVEESMPIGVVIPLSPVDRGTLVEAYGNREMDPETWLAWTRGGNMIPHASVGAPARPVSAPRKGRGKP